MKKKNYKQSPANVATSFAMYFVLTLLAISTLVPFMWMFLTGFKLNRLAMFQYFPKPWVLDNYKAVFENTSLGKSYLNSLKVAVSATFLQLITSSMAAFSFTKLKYRGRNLFYLLYIATMMVPGQVILLPQFELINKMHLYDTHLALILLASFGPFGVFLVSQSFRSMPNELLDAARIDGAGAFKSYFYIGLPMVRPALAALTILGFIGGMNDFMNPLIFLGSKEKYTLTLAMRSYATERSDNISVQMAVTSLALIPMIILYVIAQEQIMEGVAFNGGGGLKG